MSKDAKQEQKKEKQEETHIGSFSAVSKKIQSDLFKKQTNSYHFEEKKTGKTWQVSISVKELPSEVVTDKEGKKWKRVY